MSTSLTSGLRADQLQETTTAKTGGENLRLTKCKQTPQTIGGVLCTKSIETYQTEVQVKYLHLQAEVELLLDRLQKLKQERIGSKSYPAQEGEKEHRTLVSI